MRPFDLDPPNDISMLLRSGRRSDPVCRLALTGSEVTAALPATLVIVVDDEPPIVDVVCDVLEDAGIHASSCPYGNQAAACIQSKHPQLVILDVQMPGVDGIELFEQLRADPVTAGLPVIFLTANSLSLNRRLPDYRARGAVLLPKPFQIRRLVEMVIQMLDQRRGHDASSYSGYGAG